VDMFPSPPQATCPGWLNLRESHELNL
jgi:hypothetical protein